MSLTVACPGCARHLAVAPESIGQVLGCPHCHSQFQVGAPASDAAESSQAPISSLAAGGAAPRWRGSAASVPSGFKLDDPPPAKPAAIPKFKPADPSTAIASLVQDGKLPEFALAEAKSREKAAAPAEKKSRPLTLTLVLGASLVLSACLSLVDLSPGEGDADALRQARFRIANFYKEEGAALEPYQLLLRDARRAHSRGDHVLERAKYRDVLRMLRAENRPASLTDSRESDRELEAAISLALSEE